MPRLLGLLVCLALPAPAAAAPRDEPDHLRAARRLVRDVQPRNNHYAHNADQVRWPSRQNDRPALCRTDCSGLLNALLGRAYGVTEDDRRAWLGKKRPHARDYYHAAVRQNGFTRLDRVSDWRPGDVLAVHYPAWAEDTGHVLLVAAAPRRRQATAPLVPHTDQWEVGVIDCSHTGHGATDTRHRSGGGFRPGVGEGQLRVYTTSAGKVAGYTWSTWSGSPFYRPADRRLVAGRLLLPVKKAR